MLDLDLHLDLQWIGLILIIIVPLLLLESVAADIRMQWNSWLSPSQWERESISHGTNGTTHSHVITCDGGERVYRTVHNKPHFADPPHMSLHHLIQVVPPSQHTRKPHHKRTMQRVFCKNHHKRHFTKTALHWLVRFPNCHEVGWGFPNGEADFALVSINALNYLFHSHHSVIVYIEILYCNWTCNKKHWNRCVLQPKKTQSALNVEGLAGLGGFKNPPNTLPITIKQT